MKSLEQTLSEYDYPFDPSFIATEPAEPRDSAGLLVYKRPCSAKSYAGQGPVFDTFANIGKYLPKGAVLVLNDTKVFPARLHCTKKTGGRVEVFYVGSTNTTNDELGGRTATDGRNDPQVTDDDCILALTNHFLEIGERVFLTPKIWFECLGKEDKIYTLKPSFPVKDIQKIFKKYGETPIPPYIKNTKLSETQLREKYQTVFAKKIGSVAAPTASLHFTKRLLAKLKKEGIQIEFVTLHVNLGTFAPLTEEALKTGKLHKEWYEVPEKTAKALMKAKKEGRPIIAVGTTAVRTLEQWAELSPRGLPSGTPRGVLGEVGETRLFIRPGYAFRFVDGMITNFHVPKSSLLMLVSAFVGREKLFELYGEAMQNDFRFFSFGDGMLLL
ncbi:MAG: tRNA preQ1(34) S-adenosylmethionine ribosyltransferase-isomerase QueA [Candidatus Paceibacterota bacterium]|jgi:S-adenosylmethionine:tRNA ribosyltransferase-isomerase